MAEIKEILKREDIAGFVVLHTPGHSEYLNHVQTSYSCAVVMPEGVRLRLKESEVGRKRARELAEGTYNMITILTDIIALHAGMYIDCQKQIKERWGGEEGPGTHTSHEQQNN